MDPLNCIELTLKTPNQRIEDIQLKCREDWTVAKLKEHLQDVYPSKPKSSSQKLIYLGKLLQDHVVLKEVITSCARTLHIVCHETQTEGSTSQNADSSTSERSTQGVSDGVRFRGHQQTSPSVQPQTHPYQQAYSQHQISGQHVQQHPNFQQYQNNQWQHHYQMQHVVQQYYMQMHQWQHAMSTGQWPVYPNNINPYATTPPGIPNTPPQTPSTPLPPSAPNTPPAAAEERQQEEAAPVAPRQAAQANRNVPMNAGPGGAIMQDDENDNNNPANRDWLDWVYMSMRGFMLLSIIYFYSSTSRFLLVALLGLIVYLYQGGWFTPRRVEQPAPDQVDPPQNRDDTDGNNTDQNNETEQAPVEPPRPSAFRILCTFIVSFVTSLIPATPPPLQQN